MNKRTEITGVILSGGKSTRMGEDKALLLLHGKPFIQHIAETLREIFEHVFLVSDEPSRYNFLKFTQFPDIYPNCGPLGGIHSSLVHSLTDRVFIVTCDTPLLQPAFITFLLGKSFDEDALIPTMDSFSHPLCGIYHKRCLQIIEKHLITHQYSVMNLLENVTTATVHVPDSLRELAAKSFYNVNNPSDYKNIIRQY